MHSHLVYGIPVWEAATYKRTTGFTNDKPPQPGNKIRMQDVKLRIYYQPPNNKAYKTME